MTNYQKARLQVLFLITAMLGVAVTGFGQTKFLTTENALPNKYIVVLDKAKYNNGSGLMARLSAQRLATNYKGSLGFVYESAIKGFSVEMSREDAIAMSYDPEVEYVTEDNPMHMSDTQMNAQWNLDRLDQRNLPLNTTYAYSANGAGVTAYVIDSGINQFHIEFGGISSRASIGADFVGGNGSDCNGHGTHVAGTIGSTTHGVAKGVFIVAVRVFGCSGSSPSSTIIAGIDWVRANHGTRSVANMSLGGGANQATDDAVRNLIASGVTCVVAAGNDNVDANNESPARVREAVTVGASDINDNRASFSNFGNAVDVFAPGENITSTWWTGGPNVLSGTSMAAPHVTGVVAQYLQTNPASDPAKVQEIIVANASWGKVSNSGSGSPNDLLYNANFSYGENVIPLYRYYSSPGVNHFYTSKWAEMGAGQNTYVTEGVTAHLFSIQQTGTIPLYRYYNPTHVDHLYTTNFAELGNGANGYSYQGIVGYVHSTAGVGRLPLYRYWSSSGTDHYYTVVFSELGYGANSFTYEGIVGYMEP